jgi:hypothetical protein
MITPNWRRLGFTEETMNAIAHNMEQVFSEWWGPPPIEPDLVPMWCFNVLSEGMAIFAMRSMGYQFVKEELNSPRGVGTRVVQSIIFYFYGPWRDKFNYLLEDYDRAIARQRLPWIDYFREGLSVALSLQDWPSAGRLLDWVDTDLPVDEGTSDRSSEDNAYYMSLVLRFRSEAQEKISTQLALVETSRRQRVKLLAAAANALLIQDRKEFVSKLTVYLKYYCRTELHNNRVDLGICADANILWHLARYRNHWDDIVFPVELQMLLVKY